MATIKDINHPEVDLSSEGLTNSNSGGRTNGPIGRTVPADTLYRNTGTGMEPALTDGGLRDAMAYGNEFPQSMRDNPPASTVTEDDLPGHAVLSGNLRSQIVSFLNNPQIPQARKDAFLSAYGGLTSSLPHQSGFDKLSEAIIGTSNYQKAMNKLGTDVGALLAQYNVTDYQEKYNSAEQQSQRLESAGVNPDLQGTSVDAGSSADFDDQSTGATSPSSVYPNYDGSSAVGTIMQVISGVFNWASSIQGLVRNGVELSAAQTAEQSADIDFIQKLVHNSAYSPDTAVTFPDLVHSDIYNEDVSLFDKDGNLLPYSKLNAKQLDAVKSYMLEHNDFQLSGVWSNYFIDDSFSENKKRRLKARMQDYLSSEQFRRKWYEDHRNLISNRLSSLKDSSDPMFNSVDVLLESVQKALVSSDYLRQTEENIYNSEVYKNLRDNGVPKMDAEQQVRQLLRDKADNKVLDDFRDNLLKILDPKSEQGRKANKWEKLSARLGLILLFGVRQYVLHNNN